MAVAMAIAESPKNGRDVALAAWAAALRVNLFYPSYRVLLPTYVYKNHATVFATRTPSSHALALHCPCAPLRACPRPPLHCPCPCT